MIGLCRRFGGWPRAGGLYDQPAELMRMVRIVEMVEQLRGGYDGMSDENGWEGGELYG